MSKNQRPKVLLTAVATAVTSALFVLPAVADIDRLQLINGTGPSVDPGTLLDKGALFDDQFIFAGRNLTSNASAELHSALPTDAAVVSRISGNTESSVLGVTRIDEFAGSLFISNEAGLDVLNASAISTTPVAGALANSRQAVQQAGSLYLSNNSDSLMVVDASAADITMITNSVQACEQSTLATAGQSTVIYVDANGVLQKLIAPSTTPQPIFQGGVVQTFTTPCNLTTFNGKVYFDAYENGDQFSFNQIYVTDGTSSGTQRLKGFNIEGDGTYGPEFVEFGGKLLFAATFQDDVYDLWSTDGTEAGTTLLGILGAGMYQIDLRQGREYKGEYFFTAENMLWRTDGTEEGTVQVMQGTEPLELSAGYALTVFDTELHFVASVNGIRGIFRMNEPSDTPEKISGITRNVVAINGELGEKLLVSADNDLFVMDREPVLSISSSPEVAENEGTSRVTVQMTVTPTVPYEVSFDVMTEDGTAVAGNDYVQIEPTRLTIPANTPQTTQSIELRNDDIQEPTETLTLVVANPDGARFEDRSALSISGTVTITDSDQPVQAGSLQVQSTQVAENGGTASVTVITGGNSEVDITFDFTTTAGTATAGADYTTTTGSGTIAAGSSSTTITIPVLDDSNDEPNETFTVTVTPTAGLSNGLGVALPPASVTIIDDDDAPVDDEEPTPAPTSSGGGGGCSITSGMGNDPLMPTLLLTAAGVLFIRRRTGGKQSR